MNPSPGPSSPTAPPVPPLTTPPPGYLNMGPPATYAVPLPPGAVGPIQAPPSGKYCVHCRTIIARAAAYCPVCQQPQP